MPGECAQELAAASIPELDRVALKLPEASVFPSGAKTIPFTLDKCPNCRKISGDFAGGAD